MQRKGLKKALNFTILNIVEISKVFLQVGQCLSTKMKIFITTYRNYSNVFPQIVQIHLTNFTVKSNLSAKCLLAIIYVQNSLAKSLVLLQQTVATLG